MFFNYKVRDKTLFEYHNEGCRVKKRVGGEMLDSTDIHKFYGNMEMITFS